MDDFRRRATLMVKGNRFEDFEPGRRFDHHWGRTVSESDNTLFTTLTLHYNPTYFNAEHARSNGYDDVIVNPLLVFNMVFGLSVEDLSEGGGPFLGVDAMVHHAPVYVGDTLMASSVVVAGRLSEKRPGYGVVTWHTTGRNQRSEPVIEFRRTNLVRCREGATP